MRSMNEISESGKEKRRFRDRGWLSKLFLFLRSEGPGESARRAVRLLSGSLVSTYTRRIYARPCAAPMAILPAAVDAACVEIGPDRLPDVEGLMFHPTALLRRRLQAGDRCFVAIVEGRPVSYLWISSGASSLTPTGICLRPDQFYIYNVRTIRQMRGKGIFPYLSAAVCKRLGQEGFREAVIRVDAGNRPSVRAIEKAGFLPVNTVRYWRVLGLMWERPAG